MNTKFYQRKQLLKLQEDVKKVKMFIFGKCSFIPDTIEGCKHTLIRLEREYHVLP